MTKSSHKPYAKAMHPERQYWLALLSCVTLALQSSSAFLLPKLPKLESLFEKDDMKLKGVTKFFEKLQTKQEGTLEKALDLFNIFAVKEKEKEFGKLLELFEAKKVKELDLFEAKEDKLLDLIAEKKSKVLQLVEAKPDVVSSEEVEEELPALDLKPVLLPAKKPLGVITRRLPCDVVDTGNEKYFS